MKRRKPMPEWVNMLMKEMTTTPAFLQHLLENPPGNDQNGQSQNGHEGDASAESHAHESHANESNSAGTHSTHNASAGHSHAGSGDDGGDSGSASATHTRHARSSRSGRRRDDFVPAAHSARNQRPDGQANRRNARSYPESGSDSGATGTSGHKAPDVPISSHWKMVFQKAGFPTSLPKSYGWNIKRAQAVDGVLKVLTAKNRFALKNARIDGERIEFLQQAFRFVRQQGFEDFAPIVKAQSGKPWVAQNKKTFYATRWITGQRSNFSSVQQVGEIGKLLARFHDASRGFESEGYAPPMVFDLDGLLRRRTDDLRALLARAETRPRPDRFDTMLADMANQLREQAEESLRILDDPRCRTFLAEDEELPGLCHLDVIPQNFIYTPDHRMVAIDFDLCTYAPRALDLAHLLRRALQRQNWNTEVAYACFSAYHGVRPIGGTEYRLVQVLMTFPYRAWRVAHTRYRIGAMSGQLDELDEVKAEAHRREDFLDSFARQIRS